MTVINGMPISDELADFLREKCPTEQGGGTFFTAAINTISSIQDFICVQLVEMEPAEKEQAADYLSDIVLLKKDLVELTELLPIVDVFQEGGRS